MQNIIEFQNLKAKKRKFFANAFIEKPKHFRISNTLLEFEKKIWDVS